jgi:3-hydroxyisobutyrate dehydrogenase
LPEAASVHPPAAIAVVGLGNMGRPMAASLTRAGYAVTGYDLAPAARERFAQAGGRAAADVAGAVARAAVVIALLPDGKAVRAAVTAMQPHLSPGTIVIDMSSSDPIGTRALGADLKAAGFSFIDAPVSGGVKRAIDATLAIMVGGDAAVIDRVEPLLAAMGKDIFRTGPLGSGHAMKALNNYVSAAGLAAACEALAVGEKFGLDPNVMTDVLNASSGRNNTTENKLKQFIISKTFASGFSAALMAKDVNTADELGAAIGVATPLAEACAELWDDAAARLGPAADHTEYARYMAERWSVTGHR